MERRGGNAGMELCLLLGWDMNAQPTAEKNGGKD